jgi:hypothetical protein
MARILRVDGARRDQVAGRALLTRAMPLPTNYLPRVLPGLAASNPDYQALRTRACWTAFTETARGAPCRTRRRRFRARRMSGGVYGHGRSEGDARAHAR